jgi:O-antigen/teichoic acid export membrane protein
VLVWLQQYLLKRISPDEYALLPLVMSIMGFVPLISIIFTSGIGRYITIAYAKGDDVEITRIVSTMFPILLITGIVLLFIGCGFAWNITYFIPIAHDRLWDARLMLGMLMFLSAAQLAASAFNTGFVLRQKLVLQDLINIACQLLNNFLLLILILGFDARIIWVVVASTSSQMIQLLITIPFSRRLCSAQKFKLKCFDLTLAKKISAFGSWNFLGGIVATIKESLDPIILIKYASTIDVATFHIGCMPYRLISKLASPLFLPLFPVLGSLEATQQIPRMRAIYYRYSRYCIWLLFLPALPLMLFAKEIVALYIGDKYIEAHIVMRLLLSTMMLQMLTILCPAVAAVRGFVKDFALRDVWFMLLNIILTITFVVFMKMKAIGSAMATLLSMSVVYPFLMIPFSISLIEGSIKEFTSQILFPGTTPFFASLIFMIIVKNFIGLDNWASIISWSLVSGSIYILILISFCLKDSDKDEIKNIINIIRPLVSKINY